MNYLNIFLKHLFFQRPVFKHTMALISSKIHIFEIFYSTYFQIHKIKVKADQSGWNGRDSKLQSIRIFLDTDSRLSLMPNIIQALKCESECRTISARGVQPVTPSDAIIFYASFHVCIFLCLSSSPISSRSLVHGLSLSHIFSLAFSLGLAPSYSYAQFVFLSPYFSHQPPSYRFITT